MFLGIKQRDSSLASSSSSRKIGPKGLAVLAGVYLLGGVFAIEYVGSDPIPERSMLTSAAGQIEWTRKVRSRKSSSFRFKLSGEPVIFQYVSKAGQAHTIHNRLRSSRGKLVAITFDPDRSLSPLFSDETFFTVFSVQVDGKDVRSYDEVAESWGSDNTVGLWLGRIFILIGIGIAVVAFRAKSDSDSDSHLLPTD